MSSTANQSNHVLVLEGRNIFLGNSVKLSACSLFLIRIIPVIRNYTTFGNNTTNIIIVYFSLI